jgi:hypothetical protein
MYKANGPDAQYGLTGLSILTIHLILLSFLLVLITLNTKMEGRPSKEISSAEAVFVGALSSGVNVRTFFFCWCRITAMNSIFSVFHLHSLL